MQCGFRDCPGTRLLLAIRLPGEDRCGLMAEW